MQSAVLPLSKRSKNQMDTRESQEYLKMPKVSFEEVVGSKSNSMTFAETRMRRETQASQRLLRPDSFAVSEQELNLNESSSHPSSSL